MRCPAGETAKSVAGVGVSASAMVGVEMAAATADAHSFAQSQAAHSVEDNASRESEGADDLQLPVEEKDEGVREHKRKLREMMFLQVHLRGCARCVSCFPCIEWGGCTLRGMSSCASDERRERHLSVWVMCS